MHISRLSLARCCEVFAAYNQSSLCNPVLAFLATSQSVQSAQSYSHSFSGPSRQEKPGKRHIQGLLHGLLMPFLSHTTQTTQEHTSEGGRIRLLLSCSGRTNNQPSKLSTKNQWYHQSQTITGQEGQGCHLSQACSQAHHVLLPAPCPEVPCSSCPIHLVASPCCATAAAAARRLRLGL